MKAQTPPLASYILKAVGLILILLYVLDCAVLLSSARFQDSQWMLAFTTQLVDRGFLPLVGLSLLLTGFWIDEEGPSAATSNSPQGLKLAGLLLASALGLLFLLLIPVHVNTTRIAADDQLKQVTQEASKAEGQLDTQVQQLRGQVDVQLSSLDQAIRSGQIQGDQLTQAQRQQDELKKLKADPKALEAKIAPARNQELGRIRSRKQELETQIRDNALRSGMRIGLGSLLLASAYILIGWTGLRRILYSQTPRNLP